MTNYIILLPPSEGKTKGGDENKPYRMVQNLKKYNFFTNALGTEREFLYTSLKKFMSTLKPEDEEKLFELKGDKLQEAISTIQDLLNKSTKPSIQRYSGVMFNSINYEKLDKKQKEHFDESVLFIDGMFGLLKPQDLIPNYKLKITSKIGDINVTKFWKERLSGIFSSQVKNKLVIDILPEAHRKAVVLPKSTKKVEITFAEVKSGKLKQAGHASKVLKGELIQHICSKNSITIKDLKDFKHKERFKYSKEHSTDEKIVYLK